MRRRSLLAALPSLPLLVACSGEDKPTATHDSTSTPPTGYRLERIVDGLDMPRGPVPVGPGTHLLPDQTGLVHLLRDRTLDPEPVLDLTDRIIGPSQTAQELGLAGVAPSPDFKRTGHLFVVYTAEPDDRAPEGTERVDVISRWRADPSALVVDPDSEEVLLRVPHGYLDHVGGGPVFDSDGDLYVGIGAESGEPRAQETDNLDGTILRITPTRGGTYRIPRSNPFATKGGEPEIFSYGLRNPFRMHWDDELGLVVALPMWTEMDQQVGVATRGGNSGYPLISLTETDTCWTDGTLAPDCQEIDGTEITPPVAEYPRNVGDIISGVVVYRGSVLRELTGKVVVADWKGTLLAGRPGSPPWPLEPLEVADPESEAGTLWDLRTDGEEIYACYTNFGGGKGRVYRLVPTP